jgi:hypothetical protein
MRLFNSRLAAGFQLDISALREEKPDRGVVEYYSIEACSRIEARLAVLLARMHATTIAFAVEDLAVTGGEEKAVSLEDNINAAFDKLIKQIQSLKGDLGFLSDVSQKQVDDVLELLQRQVIEPLREGLSEQDEASGYVDIRSDFQAVLQQIQSVSIGLDPKVQKLRLAAECKVMRGLADYWRKALAPLDEVDEEIAPVVECLDAIAEMSMRMNTLYQRGDSLETMREKLNEMQREIHKLYDVIIRDVEVADAAVDAMALPLAEPVVTLSVPASWSPRLTGELSSRRESALSWLGWDDAELPDVGDSLLAIEGGSELPVESAAKRTKR